MGYASRRSGSIINLLKKIKNYFIYLRDTNLTKKIIFQYNILIEKGGRWFNLGSNDENCRTRSICELLSTLPPHYSISEIVVDGVTESVNYFITLDSSTNLAYFSSVSGGLVIADCRRISQVVVPGA